jgi:aryl-alcohol dehydrogenase-like predicted oxidoreductase
LGITCLDTAPSYGLGRVEELLTEVLEPRRQDVVVTMCGKPDDQEQGRWLHDTT